MSNRKFLQETNFQEEEDDSTPERRAKDQVLRTPKDLSKLSGKERTRHLWDN